ncbi:hypothetical protein TRL7639_03877 [Falsiruegeria litorea R37]|uniref:Uncharacterized protein n=1 Tax=Falsiruegeria litorea R37 TaxID=1200284 RepID=A0A1Y5TQH8_9RHOB|nr:hypothetical protein [Falsiruegeria litorea]SLN67363.1 hypothetical protein TRL7639_03877 [Falsiruegeria litorea R37]
MRFLLTFLCFGTPALGWHATQGDVCTLSHDTEEAQIFLTHDPSKPLYTLTVTLKAHTWATSPWFAMRFDGSDPIEIATARHALSKDRFDLTAADTGFGNVLDGLEFNDTAMAFTQTQTVYFPLKGAAPEVRKFRNCAGAALS